MQHDRIGHGNAKFIADLAMGVSDAELRRRWERGEYAGIGKQFVAGWRKLAGRS
jgi:hypothetical protein